MTIKNLKATQLLSQDINQNTKPRGSKPQTISQHNFKFLSNRTPMLGAYNYPVNVLNRQLLIERANPEGFPECAASCCRLLAHKGDLCLLHAHDKACKRDIVLKGQYGYDISGIE